MEERRIAHYRLLQRLGSGGMGEVHLAENTRLGLKVALKFLAPDLARDPEARKRFLLEARAAAGLSHPNIAGIHDIEEHEGSPFLVLEYLEGETLRDRLGRGPLGIDELLDVAEALAAGLAHAHGRGIVHRDIKPGNVMLTRDGRICLLDFGLARAEDATRITRAGMTVGTLHSMSPEQARGQLVDARSDLWSVGVLLYECLVGRRPFEAEGNAAVLQRILHDEPVPLTALRSDVGLELERIVLRLLQKDPALRYQHADDLLSDLALLRSRQSPTAVPVGVIRPSKRGGWRAGAIAAVLLLVVMASVFLLPPLRDRLVGRGALSKGAPKLAVLFIENLGGDPHDDLLAAALTEDVIAGLARNERLRVYSRSAVERYREKPADAGQLRADLGVDYVVEGSIRKMEENYRWTTHLVDARQGLPLWTGQYTGNLARIVVLEDSVALNVGRALGLTPAEARPLIARRWTENAEAYAFFLMGRERYWDGGSPQRAADSREWFERALRLDPQYAPALAGLAYSLAMELELDGTDEPGRLVRALQAARRARELDLELALAWRAEALALFQSGRPQEARVAAERAIEVHPALAEGHHLLARILLDGGRREEARRVLEGGIEIDPYWTGNYVELARLLRATGDSPGAEEVLLAGLERLPGDPRLELERAALRQQSGDPAGAVELLLPVARRRPDDFWVQSQLATALLQSGSVSQADSLVHSTLERWPDCSNVSQWAGWNALQRGDPTRAEELLRRALQQNPNAFWARLRLALCLRAGGRAEEAEALLAEARERWPENPELCRQLTNYYLQSRDLARAEQWARREVELRPSSADAYGALGRIHFTRGEFELAIEAFRKVVELRPDAYDAYYLLSGCLSSLGRREEALEAAEESVRSNPRSVWGHLLLGEAYHELGRFHQAAASYEKAVELGEGAQKAAALGTLATVYIEEGRFDRALEASRSAVALDSSSATPWAQMAEVALRYLGDQALAETAALRACELGKGENAAVLGWATLGCVARERGEVEEADRAFDQAVAELADLMEASPDAPWTHSAASYLHVCRGDSVRARRALDELLSVEAGAPSAHRHAATVLALLGDRESALAQLEQAVDAGYMAVAELEADRQLASVRSGERWSALLQRLR